MFEAGFLAACETDVRRKTEAEVVFGRPGWATVKRLRFRAYAALSSRMRGLEEAHGVTEAALERLATVELPRLRVLGITENASRGAGDGLRGGVPTTEGLHALAAATGMPSLREIHLHLAQREYRDGRFRARGPADFAWLLDGPAGAHLEAIHVPLHDELREVRAAWLALVETGWLWRFGITLPEASVVVEHRAGKLAATATRNPGPGRDPAAVQSRIASLRDALGAVPLMVADDPRESAPG